MNYNIFINEWIRRSERKEKKDYIDMGDKFVSLWIAFNAWLKSEFGETKADGQLIKNVIGFEPMEKVFNEFKKGNKDLVWLKGYKIINMQYQKNENKKQEYNGSFESLMWLLYAIRCNLFHGRKNFDDNEVDKKLVELAYKILSPLFKKYLKKLNQLNL